MFDRRDIGSWMDGPAPTQQYPGQRLGRPPSGPGSIARFAPRAVGLFIDWFIALGLTALLVPGGGDLIPVLVWMLTTTLQVGLMGRTVGHWAGGLQVQTMAGRPVSWWQALVRTVLTGLVIPAVIIDGDQRGLPDRAATTVLVKVR